MLICLLFAIFGIELFYLCFTKFIVFRFFNMDNQLEKLSIFCIYSTNIHNQRFFNQSINI